MAAYCIPTSGDSSYFTSRYCLFHSISAVCCMLYAVCCMPVCLYAVTLPHPIKSPFIFLMANFCKFQDTWLDQLHILVARLADAPTRPTSPEDTLHLRHLVHSVLSHYQDYYDAKASFAVSHVLLLFSAPWASALERSLHWVAGFRPTTIFHLMYTESSIRFESRVADILLGRRAGGLGELTPAQFGRVSDLQCLAVKEENEIGDELGAWQEAVARAEPEWAGLIGDGSDRGMERLLERLGEVVAKADELRMRTIRQVVELLTPQQAAEFIVAAAELQFGIRAWGLHHDRERGAGRVYC